MITWGEQSDGSDHDKHLTEFLQVTRKCNLKFKIDLFETTFMSDGHQPENEKVQTINKMPQPTNIKNQQCFSGIVNYLIRYSLRLAELDDSLRDLTKKLYHLFGDLNILKHLMLSKMKLPVPLCSNNMALKYL